MSGQDVCERARRVGWMVGVRDRPPPSWLHAPRGRPLHGELLAGPVSRAPRVVERAAEIETTTSTVVTRCYMCAIAAGVGPLHTDDRATSGLSLRRSHAIDCGADGRMYRELGDFS